MMPFPHFPTLIGESFLIDAAKLHVQADQPKIAMGTGRLFRDSPC